MDSTLKARFERLGPVRDVPRNPSGSAAAVQLVMGEGLAQPVTAVLALTRRGATMLRAKRAIEAAMAGGSAILALSALDDAQALRQEMAEAGFAALLVPKVRQVDLAALRRRLGMTRDQFALAYGLDVETVRNWEAGRRDPGPARAYLQAIDNDPEAVRGAYAGNQPSSRSRSPSPAS